jgi:hypothetical protein
MIKYYSYKFLIKHDNGSFFLKAISTDIESAKKAIMNAENCPESALNFVSKELRFVHNKYQSIK